MSSFRFEGKVAIVTGAASGIGRAIAEQLSRGGASVIIADRNAAGAEATARLVQKNGGSAHFIEMDLGNLADGQRTVDAARKHFGRLDILINCAATHGPLRPILDTVPADWNEVFQTNVFGTFALTQAAVRQMLAQGQGGAVVNLLAVQAFKPMPTYGPYAASKGALTSLTHSLAVELADKGIRINGIVVGSVYTESVMEALDITGGAEQTFAVPAELDRSAAALVGRMGRPDDIANVACFLASEDASYLAGAILPAEGGLLLSRKPDPFLTAMQPANKDESRQ